MMLVNGMVPPSAEFLSRREAEQYARLNYQTLRRHQRAGRDTGLRKQGGRVVFVLSILREFLSQDAPALPTGGRHGE